jgi:uncharacterized phiE125 gp8 family phage protein
MSIQVVTPPAVEVVTLSEAKSHLRVPHNADDAYITRTIIAAREQCEHELNRAIGEQSMLLLLDEFPTNVYGIDEAIELPITPVVGIDAVRYYDDAGVLTVVDPSNYAVDTGQAPAWLLAANDFAWPVTDDRANAVQIEYTAGWAPVACPASIKQWMLMMIGSMYENREQTSSAAAAATLGFVARMIDRYRVHVL